MVRPSKGDGCAAPIAPAPVAFFNWPREAHAWAAPDELPPARGPRAETLLAALRESIYLLEEGSGER
jgi:hypothetical protein